MSRRLYRSLLRYSEYEKKIFLKTNIYFLFKMIVTTPPPPAPQIAQTPLPVLTPLTVGPVGPKTGQLIDYGRILGGRAGPIGWILALVAGLLLLPLAIAFAARQCTRGACCPRPATGYVPVTTGTTGATQTGIFIIIKNEFFLSSFYGYRKSFNN
jgi:hypothetical protein